MKQVITDFYFRLRSATYFTRKIPYPEILTDAGTIHAAAYVARVTTGLVACCKKMIGGKNGAIQISIQ